MDFDASRCFLSDWKRDEAPAERAGAVVSRCGEEEADQTAAEDGKDDEDEAEH